jgi:prevent-host-death family protein
MTVLDKRSTPQDASSSPLRVVSATDANRGFSAMLRRVKRGETVAITSRGKVVARLVPEPEPEDEKALRAKREALWAATLERLRSQPLMNLGKFNRDWAYDD